MQYFSSTYNIVSASHFTRHVRKKNPQNHPHFTRLKIRRSADPHFTVGRFGPPFWARFDHTPFQLLTSEMERCLFGLT